MNALASPSDASAGGGASPSLSHTQLSSSCKPSCGDSGSSPAPSSPAPQPNSSFWCPPVARAAAAVPCSLNGSAAAERGVAAAKQPPKPQANRESVRIRIRQEKSGSLDRKSTRL